MAEIGTKLRFNGEPHAETGEPQHLGVSGTLHVLAGYVDAETGKAISDTDHQIPIGSVGEVVAHVSAEVDGAGSHDADCTVLAFPELANRHISFEDEQLDAWFSPVEGAS